MIAFWAQFKQAVHLHSDPDWQVRGIVRYEQCRCGARRTSWATHNLRGPVEPGWPAIKDRHGQNAAESVWTMPEALVGPGRIDRAPAAAVTTGTAVAAANTARAALASLGGVLTALELERRVCVGLVDRFDRTAGLPAPVDSQPHKRPMVITLCGSTRFRPELEAAAERLTLAGHIVISVGVFWHSREIRDRDLATKRMLDELHRAKIDLADEIFVVNPNRYIGESTRNEIAYAVNQGKAVRYLIDPDQAVTESSMPSVSDYDRNGPDLAEIAWGSDR